MTSGDTSYVATWATTSPIQNETAKARTNPEYRCQAGVGGLREFTVSVYREGGTVFLPVLYSLLVRWLQLRWASEPFPGLLPAARTTKKAKMAAPTTRLKAWV